MKTPPFSPDTQVEDQRNSFWSRYMMALLNYGDRIDKNNPNERKVYVDAIHRYYEDEFDTLDKARNIQDTPVYNKPDTGRLTPDIGRFKDHHWDQYLLDHIRKQFGTR